MAVLTLLYGMDGVQHEGRGHQEKDPRTAHPGVQGSSSRLPLPTAEGMNLQNERRRQMSRFQILISFPRKNMKQKKRKKKQNNKKRKKNMEEDKEEEDEEEEERPKKTKTIQKKRNKQKQRHESKNEKIKKNGDKGKQENR